MSTESPLLARRQINLIVTGLLIGMFMSALDQMVVSTAIRTIGDDLNGLNVTLKRLERFWIDQVRFRL